MRSSRFALVLLTAIVAACSALPGESLGSAPVYTLNGHVDVSKLRANGKPLSVALAWGAVPAYPQVCVTHGNKYLQLKEACGSPFTFRIGQYFPGQPLVVDEAGNFTYTVGALPEARLTVGSQAGRVAYGSLVIYEDIAQLGGFQPGEAGEEPASRVVAASFASLTLPQHRIVLREGEWDIASMFYPHVGCTVPPPGFSLMKATLGISPQGELQGSCEIQPTTQPVEILPLSELDAKAISCPANVGSAHPEWISEPPTNGICLDAGTLLIPTDATNYCPAVQVVLLKGCYDPARTDCDKEPDWDVTATPPDWWSCP